MIGCWGVVRNRLHSNSCSVDISVRQIMPSIQSYVRYNIHTNAETGRLEYSILYYKADRNGGIPFAHIYQPNLLVLTRCARGFSVGYYLSALHSSDSSCWSYTFLSPTQFCLASISELSSDVPMWPGDLDLSKAFNCSPQLYVRLRHRVDESHCIVLIF